jgi:hypothetical protein
MLFRKLEEDIEEVDGILRNKGYFFMFGKAEDVFAVLSRSSKSNHRNVVKHMVEGIGKSEIPEDIWSRVHSSYVLNERNYRDIDNRYGAGFDLKIVEWFSDPLELPSKIVKMLFGDGPLNFEQRIVFFTKILIHARSVN